MKNNKKSVVVALCAVVFIGMTLLFAKGVTQKPFIGDGIALYRTVLKDMPTTQGFVYIPFVRTGDEFPYVNVGVDVNGDGTILGYETPNGYQEEWMVQNDFPELLEGEANRFPIKIIDDTFGVKPIVGVAVLSKEAFAGGAWSKERVASEREKKSFTITEVVMEVRDLHNTLDGAGVLATGKSGLFDIPVAHAQAAPPPAPLPGDYYARHMDVPDQNQLWNECAPTAISNSFRWLAKEYKLEDRMPKGDVNDLIDEIKGDVAWNDGVAHENIISGKTAFIKRHNLPIEAHQVGGTEDPDIVSKMADEINKGQAIEVWLSFFGADGRPAGAHLVTVVGAGRKNGKDIVRFSDPDTLGAPSRDAYEVQMGNFLPDYMPGGQTYIRYAYAQSPIKELTDKTWVDPRNDGAVAVGGGGVSLTEPDEDVTLSRSQFGFFSTSVGHPGDHYVGDTFPVRASVYKTGKTRDVNFTDRDGARWVWTHGAEKPWTLKGAFLGGGAVEPLRAEDRPPLTSVSQDRFSVEANFTCVAPGFATVAYDVDIGWVHSSDVPAPIQRFTHGTEFESTSDHMRVESPVFRCIAKAVPKKDEPRTAAPQSFCPNVNEDPNGKEIEVLKVGSECYPTMLFHEANPDKCDAKHWHANQGSARSLAGATWVDPSGCGLGKISQVATGKVMLSLDQVAPYIESIQAWQQ